MSWSDVVVLVATLEHSECSNFTSTYCYQLDSEIANLRAVDVCKPSSSIFAKPEALADLGFLKVFIDVHRVRNLILQTLFLCQS